MELLMTEKKQNIIQAVKEYGRQLFGFIRGRVNTNEDAEDILQDVWYQLSSQARLDDIESISGWLYRVARNRITDTYRKKKNTALNDGVADDEEWLVPLFMQDKSGNPVFLTDLWPAEREIQETMLKAVRSDMFKTTYARVFEGDERWRALPTPEGDRFEWDLNSTYIRKPPFFDGLTLDPKPLTDIMGARVLALLGDSVTTDHISPAGSIPADSPAGKYLIEHGVTPREFNSYGARRGNHEVMMRGTFANIRLRNQVAPGTEGGWTTLLPDGDVMTIYDASVKYRERNVPLIVLAGKEYGSGSSRDWAAKGTLLLGVGAVIAESFERIHRSNLVNMGVLPLQFKAGETVASYQLTGRERFDIQGVTSLRPRREITVRATADDGSVTQIPVMVRIDTPEELESFRHGGILPYVLRQLVTQ